MKKIINFVLVAALGFSLMACSTVKRFTGQTDDSVLPGAREEILPPDAQTARDPKVTGKEPSSVECLPDDVNCAQPVDQEASTAQ